MRLAAQLTGWKLDINSESRVKELREFADCSLGTLPGINEMLVETLYAHGFRMARDIAEANPEVLAQIPGIDAAKVVEMQEKARSQMGGDAEELRQARARPPAAPAGGRGADSYELSQDERLARGARCRHDQRGLVQAVGLRHGRGHREGNAT